MPTSTTLAQLLRDICSALGEGDSRFPAISTTTGAGAGDATTLVDSGLLYSGADVDALGQCFVRIDEAVAGGPAAGEISRISSAGLDIASGTITVSPAFSAQVQSGTDYSLWRHTHPLVARRLLNENLRNKKREVITPVTLVVDGDMELAADVTNWTTIGTVSTKEKVTTAAYVRHGGNSLHIVNGAAASGARTASYPATRERTWLVAATIKVITGTVSLAGYDATNSVDIDTPPSTNEPSWQTLFYTFTIPATCQNVQARITAGDAAEFYVDEVILWQADQMEYEPPSWLEDPSDIIDIGYFTMETSPEGTNVYIPEESNWQSCDFEREPFVDEAGLHPFRVYLTKTTIYPLFLRALRPFAELSADTDTTTADRRGLVLQTLWSIFDYLLLENIKNKDVHDNLLRRRGEVIYRASRRLAGSRELRPRPVVKAVWGTY